MSQPVKTGKHGIINSGAYSDIDIAAHPERERIEATIIDAQAEAIEHHIHKDDHEELFEAVYEFEPENFADYIIQNGDRDEATDWLVKALAFVRDN